MSSHVTTIEQKKKINTSTTTPTAPVIMKVTDFHSMDGRAYADIYTHLDRLETRMFDSLLLSLRKFFDTDRVTLIMNSRKKASSLMTALIDFDVKVPEFYEVVRAEGLLALTDLLQNLCKT